MTRKYENYFVWREYYINFAIVKLIITLKYRRYNNEYNDND